MQKIKNKILSIFILTIFCLPFIIAHAEEVIPDPIITPDVITLSSIAIATPATKLIYTVGDALDISGLSVTGVYSDGSTKGEVITETNITGFSNSIPITGQILTITVGGQIVTYTVDINAVIVEEKEEDKIFDITLKDNCEIKDTSDVLHKFPKGDSPSKFLAVCALVAAQDALHINSLTVSDSSFGLSPVNINGVNPGATEYWALWVNGGFASCGIGCLPLIEGDNFTLVLSDWMANTESTTIKLHIIKLEDTVVANGGGCTTNCGGSGPSPAPVFSIQNAVSYLESTQASDGSFGGNTMYTDWASIALASGGINNSVKTKILGYLKANNNLSSTLTDNERRAMALLSLGQNPYSFNNVDYVSTIIKSFDGTQFGDNSLINDDVFALIPLASSGYTLEDNIITKSIAFILSKQNSDGSWEGSVDLTAATIQALYPFNSAEGVSSALTNASLYLQKSQESDGGWSNISSSSWAIQAMNTLGVSWTKNNKTVYGYLGVQQTVDGAVLPTSEMLSNRIWATSYVIPAMLKLPWSAVMQSVPKPITQNSASLGSNSDSQKEVSLKEEKIVVIPDPIVLLTADIPITEVKVLKQKIVSTSKETPTIETSKIEIETSSNRLIATAEQSGSSLPNPVLVLIILGASIFVFLVRRFLLK